MTDQPQNDPQQPQYAAPQHQTQHQPPYQYAQPGAPQGQRPGTEKNWMNITSLALSLGGLVTGGLTAIAGIVFGHLGLSAVKRGEADNRSLGLAGLITGYVIIGLGIIVTILAVVFFATVFTGVVEECTSDTPASWCTDSTTSDAWAAVTGAGL
ncbi:DUF4190 domain-containing protein [Demequina sp. NBRC 110057]|uniref:DUF4190 domain-containing protein n=1 Tax=Demequina sp. NBRC 110057 TaxID=1570346 RepID=UPI0009FDD883|nr:DUF4190 domain-containing protein [Demequina sp. NBRC 110057]